MPTGETDSLVIVHRLITALNRLHLDEALELTSPDIRVETPLIELWHLSRSGHGLVRDWFERIGREWAFLEAYDIELEELDSWVLGRMRARGRGKGSREVLEWELHIAARVAGGKVARFGSYLDRQRARDAIASDLR